MQEEIRARLRDVAQRAGLRSVPPASLAAGVAVCALVLVAAVWHWWPASRAADTGLSIETAASPAGEGGSASAASPGGLDGAASSESTTLTPVFVHVVGAVRAPGVYELPGGARIADAIASAGGMLGSAEQRAVNLAREVVDGEQIIVPTQDEFAKSGSPAPTPPSGGSGVANPIGISAGSPVDINSADAAALDTLPGIGPSTAAKIVADREANGPFNSPEDLGRVSGIGPKKLETLLGLIVAR